MTAEEDAGKKVGGAQRERLEEKDVSVLTKDAVVAPSALCRTPLPHRYVC